MNKFIFPLIVLLVGVNCQDAVKAPVESTPIETLTNPVPAIESNPTLAATPSSAPAATPLNAPAAAPISANQPIEGTTTEHRSPDGSIITITKFNGNLPASIVQPYAQAIWQPFEMQRQIIEANRIQQEAMLRHQNAMFSNTLYNLYNNAPFNNFYQLTTGGFNPFYQPYYNPFFWPYGQMQMNGQQPQPGAPLAAPPPPALSEKRSRRATKVVEQEKLSVPPSYISTLPKRPRHNPAFHFPATVEDYWKMHKRPEVPITENLVK